MSFWKQRHGICVTHAVRTVIPPGDDGGCIMRSWRRRGDDVSRRVSHRGVPISTRPRGLSAFGAPGAGEPRHWVPFRLARHESLLLDELAVSAGCGRENAVRSLVLRGLADALATCDPATSRAVLDHALGYLAEAPPGHRRPRIRLGRERGIRSAAGSSRGHVRVRPRPPGDSDGERTAAGQHAADVALGLSRNEAALVLALAAEAGSSLDEATRGLFRRGLPGSLGGAARDRRGRSRRPGADVWA
jgi:hypothetical protein